MAKKHRKQHKYSCRAVVYASEPGEAIPNVRCSKWASKECQIPQVVRSISFVLKSIS